jgi:hypothetical protein
VCERERERESVCVCVCVCVSVCVRVYWQLGSVAAELSDRPNAASHTEQTQTRILSVACLQRSRIGLRAKAIRQVGVGGVCFRSNRG